MSWEDRPTENQLDVVYWMLRSGVTVEMARTAARWLGKNANRKQVSDELRRLRDLKLERKLDECSCFAGDVWRDFDGDKYPTSEQRALVYAILRRHMPIGRAALASNWLGENATRKEIAEEIDRLKGLEKRYALDEEQCFISDIWKKYNK